MDNKVITVRETGLGLIAALGKWKHPREGFEFQPFRWVRIRDGYGFNLRVGEYDYFSSFVFSNNDLARIIDANR